MESEFDDLVPSRNPRAEERHRREVLTQITLPMILLVVLMGAACGLTAWFSTTGGTTGLWRDVSLIYMLLVWMLVALIPFAILAGLAYGVIALIRVLPEYTFKIQKFFTMVSEGAHKFADAVAAPAVSIGGFFAALGRLFRSSGNTDRAAK